MGSTKRKLAENAYPNTSPLDNQVQCMRRREDEPNRSSHAHSHAGDGCTGSACIRAQDVSFAKEKGGKTRYRMMSSHWKQWRIFKSQDVKRKRKVSLTPIIGRPAILAESHPEKSVSTGPDQDLSWPGPAGRVCWLFIFFHGS